ncbi:hypothetical protein CEXT_209841 [Caerostris extrusa]|uniref:Uncharacterized protein n=1 Tax=Caerostris extrusa TaxID=172846 RepID=A0AAV4WJP5_CAEEX|nr:hypothetical protein CEXT_209841 [Caerostris extrusa]
MWRSAPSNAQSPACMPSISCPACPASVAQHQLHTAAAGPPVLDRRIPVLKLYGNFTKEISKKHHQKSRKLSRCFNNEFD